MKDIIYKKDNLIFSYRVAGVLIKNNKILLQKTIDDNAYAIPGGHVQFGETSKEALEREFKEETGTNIEVGKLKWVGEVYFDWDNKKCHQICLFYDVTLKDYLNISNNSFASFENKNIEFYWINLDDLNKIFVYPVNIIELLKKDDVQYFIYKE